MTLDYVANLRNELPELFDERQLPTNWDENWIAIPFDDEVESILNPSDDRDDYENNGEIPRHPEIEDIFPTFAKTNFGQKVGNKKVPADLLAFYLPFHLFPDDWGIYILASGVQYLARIIRLQSKLEEADALLVSRLFLYYHELYHHKVEMFVTRLEVPQRQPIYKTRKLFEKKSDSEPWPTLNLTEEALANADAFMRTINQLEAISQTGGYPQISTAIVEPILAEFIRQNPPGYNEALNYGRPHLFNFQQCVLAEQIQLAACSDKDTTDTRIWSLFFNDVNDEKSYGVNERVFVVFERSSQLVRFNPLLPLCKPNELKKVLKKLDCQYSRPGKGSHEIWKNKNGEIIPFPVHRGKDMKKGTVQKILEAATGSKLSETQIKKLLHKLG
jgi:predicted RNA binding protein YcfA (HicA-like mRNA interferase family)